MSTVPDDLPLVTYVFDPNFSLNFQLLHLQNPSLNSASHLWILYRQLYNQALHSRIYTSNGKGGDLVEERFQFYRRRIIVHQIFTILNALGTMSPQEKSLLPDFLQDKSEEERDGRLTIPTTFLDSLIVFLMDIEPYTGLTSIPRLSTLIEVDSQGRKLWHVLPYNVLGTSCFCDSVIVAMFIATDFYDIMLDSEETFTPFPWEDKQLIGGKFAGKYRTWIRDMKSDVKKSACYRTQELEKEEKRGETKEIKPLEDEEVEEIRRETIGAAKEIQTLMREIVTSMRDHVPKGSTDKVSGNTYEYVLGGKVSGLRKELSSKCRRGEAEAQEDIAEMFRSLLELGSWENRFLPVTLRIDSQEYYQDSNLLYTNTKVVIEPPDLPFFSMKTRETQSLQELISMHLNVATKIDPTYIKSIQLNQVISSTSGFLRLPDVLPFRIQRFDFVAWDKPSRKISTHVTIPKNQELVIPVMSFSASIISTGKPPFHAENNWKYRITAMACHLGATDLGGHYVLYFRYNGSGEDWYYYNDMNSDEKKENRLLKVDIFEDKIHRDTIEQNAYLFWAKRL